MELKPIRCRIPELLHVKGHNQQWLSDITGISRQQISDYCTKRSVMSLRTAALIANKIGCRIDDLYVWEWRQAEK